MEKCFQLPPDFMSRGPFRGLRSVLGSELSAAGVVAILWRDLSYAADVHGRPGFLSDGQVGMLRDALGLESDPMPMLSSEGGYLRREDGGWFCAAFAAHNRHLSGNTIHMQKLGGLMRGVESRKKALAVEAQQQSLFVPPEVYRRPDGERMDPEQVNRVTMLIKLVDNYTQRTRRGNAEFTEGLVQDAFEVLARHSEEEISRVCVYVHAQRGATAHPAVPQTTEQVLRPETFRRLLDAVEEMSIV
jgi:hypothetical protein